MEEGAAGKSSDNTKEVIMDKTFMPALIWGTVCFLLLYCTLPSDFAQWWQVHQQFGVPMLQLLANSMIAVIPALMPLVCYVILSERVSSNKGVILVIPVMAWLIAKLVILGVLYFIAAKTGDMPLYAEGFFSLVGRIVTPHWLINALAYILTIMASSYAFWRECR